MVEQIKKNWDVFSKNKLITGEKDLYNKLSDYNELADEPMPETIYLNGFGAGFSDDDINSVKEKHLMNAIALCLTRATVMSTRTGLQKKLTKIQNLSFLVRILL